MPKKEVKKLYFMTMLMPRDKQKLVVLADHYNTSMAEVIAMLIKDRYQSIWGAWEEVQETDTGLYKDGRCHQPATIPDEIAKWKGQ